MKLDISISSWLCCCHNSHNHRSLGPGAGAIHWSSPLYGQCCCWSCLQSYLRCVSFCLAPSTLKKKGQTKKSIEGGWLSRTLPSEGRRQHLSKLSSERIAVFLNFGPKQTGHESVMTFANHQNAIPMPIPNIDYNESREFWWEVLASEEATGIFLQSVRYHKFKLHFHSFPDDNIISTILMRVAAHNTFSDATKLLKNVTLFCFLRAVIDRSY